MKTIYKNYCDLIGNTPIVELSKFSRGLKAKIFAKIESMNPAFSVKDRIVSAMIRDAISRNLLKKGMIILEPTSGNTGIALAMVGNIMGFKVKLAMPESMSLERRSLMKLLGATFILTPSESGMKGAIDRVNEIMKAEPEKYYMPDQFNNLVNPGIHEATTGPEIYRDMDGEVGALIAGVGTGGTLCGAAKFLKKVARKPLCAVAVEPFNCPAITKYLREEKFEPAPHNIQGIGPGFIPKTLDLSLIDRVEMVEDVEAMSFTKDLYKKEGIIAGISSGANLAVACRLAREDNLKNKHIVIIIADTGERYLSYF